MSSEPSPEPVPVTAIEPGPGGAGDAGARNGAAGAPGREELAFLFVALLGGLARFYRLGEWSLWIDEAYTLADAHHAAGNYNPLGYALVRWTAEAFGRPPDEASLRFAAATAGWLLVPLTWWGLRPLAGGRRAAAAALLVAASPWQLYWSQTARFYTLAGVPALLGLGVLARGLRAGRVVPALAGLALVGAGASLHLQAALLAGALGAATVGVGLRSSSADQRRIARAVAIAGALSLVLVGAWVYGVFDRYRDVKPSAPLASLAHLARSTVFFLTPTLVLAAGAGACAAFGRRKERGVQERGVQERGGALLLLTLLVGGAGACAAALLARSTAQYAFLFMPFVAALAVWPLGVEPLVRAPFARAGYVLVLAGTLAAGSALYFLAREGERPRWREAYEYVAERRDAGDLILGMQAPVGEFYLSPGATDLRRPRSVAWLSPYDPYAWARWADRRRAMWIVVRPDFLQEWPARERADLAAFLREDCRLERRFDVHLEGRDLDVEVWRRP